MDKIFIDKHEPEEIKKQFPEAEKIECPVEYEGFATPCLILTGSDDAKITRGDIVDPYAKTAEQDGLMCGVWARGLEDELIHLYLISPVAAICEERAEWAAAKTWIRKPIDYMEGVFDDVGSKKSVKKQPEIDVGTGVVKW